LLTKVGRVGDCGPGTGRTRDADASIDAALGTMRPLVFALARDGITIKAGSRGDLMGLTGLRGVGLVDLLLAVEEIGEVACRIDSGASLARGLGSNAWMILFAVFMERETDGE
jgi:hypothetical protein